MPRRTVTCELPSCRLSCENVSAVPRSLRRDSLSWVGPPLSTAGLACFARRMTADPGTPDVTRLLDLDRESLADLRGRALTAAVAASEGRTMVAEVVAGATGLVAGVHDAEVVAALGADVIVLNLIETALTDGGWIFPGIGAVATLGELSRRLGRPVGVNLEPGDVPGPRQATAEVARRLLDDGAALFVLTANPGTGSTYADLARVSGQLRAAVGPDAAVWAGKMHHAGIREPATPDALVSLVEAGADGVLLPVPGTVPGVMRESAHEACAAAQDAGAVVLGTVGTSQEGTAVDVARALAVVAKEVGVDAHHLGDAGLGRAPDPELVYAWSVAVRGRRHTWRRMAWGNRTR